MLTRLFLLVAALVLAVASADAHVGAHAWQPESAPPARASVDRTASGEYADATPSRIREKSVGAVKVASGLCNQPYAQVIEDWTSSASQAGTVEPVLPTASLQSAYVFGDDLINQVRFSALAANVVPGQPGSTLSAGNDAASRIGLSNGESVYHYDGLGSTRFLTAVNLDAAGNPITTGTPQNPANETLTDQYGYAAFGDNDVAVTDGTTANNYRYTGEQLDPSLTFYYLRARYMNPGQGRFMGMDPWSGCKLSPLSLNKFAYVQADPIANSDPSGWTNTIEQTTTLEDQAILQTTAEQYGGRAVFRKVGCEVFAAISEQAITYGIYVLSDGLGQYYVGQAEKIDRRIAEHARDIAKRGFKEVARFFVEKEGGRDLLRLAEQSIFETLKEEIGRNKLTNKIEPLDKKKGRLKDIFKKFKACK